MLPSCTAAQLYCSPAVGSSSRSAPPVPSHCSLPLLLPASGPGCVVHCMVKCSKLAFLTNAQPDRSSSLIMSRSRFCYWYCPQPYMFRLSGDIAISVIFIHHSLWLLEPQFYYQYVGEYSRGWYNGNAPLIGFCRGLKIIVAVCCPCSLLLH